MPITPVTRIAKTLFVATDSDNLGDALDVVYFAQTPTDAVDAWLESYTDHPRFIYEVQVVKRATVKAPTQVTMDWETV
jgi:hypothetical protein